MKIYLDVDGVLADFISASQRAHNRPLERPTQWHYYRGWGLSSDQFWGPINEQGKAFWGGLDKLPWADEVVELCEMISGQRVTFLTMPCAVRSYAELDRIAGRKTWILRNYPGRESIIGENKPPYARRDRVLVDDHTKNVSEWREAGGHAILFNGLACQMGKFEKLARLAGHLYSYKDQISLNARLRQNT